MKTTFFTVFSSLILLAVILGDSLWAQQSIPLTPPGVSTSRSVSRSYGSARPASTGAARSSQRPSAYGAGQPNYPIRPVSGEEALPPSLPELQAPAPAPVPAPAPTENAEMELPEPVIPDLSADGAAVAPSDAHSVPAELPLRASEPIGAPTEPSELPLTPVESPLGIGEPRVYNSAEPLPMVDAPALLPPQTAPTVNERTEPAAFTTGQGEPGAKALMGPQTPQIIIEKIAPEELLVGKSAVWKTVVKNVGQTIAAGLEIRDLVPKGTQLIETTPPAAKGINGELVWKIGDLPPGNQVVVGMELMPLDEGRVGSVAQITYQSAASAEGQVAKPQLAIQTQGVRQIGIGNSTELTIILSNPGTGAAKNVVLTENVPPQLQHEANDSVLTYNVGDLKPDESRTIKLKMTAIRPGKFVNSLTATAEPGLNAESRFDMEVIAPELKMTVDGPTRRFLEREGAYKITVSNPGTAPARNVAMRVQLPTGLQFVSANNAGAFDKQTRVVRWLLEELPPNDTGEVELIVSPTQIGQQAIIYQASADKGVAVNGQKDCVVEGMAALLTQLSDTSDPVLIGERTTYNIHVVNQGSKASINVRVSAQIPAGMEFLNAEGPTNYHVGADNTIIFDPAPQLSAKAEMNYKILVKGIAPGDQRLKLSVISDELSSPVTKEESTQVYQDQQ